MTIEKCENNVRCNVAGCNKMATTNIDTNGFKGNLCLCDECLKQLEKLIKTHTKRTKPRNLCMTILQTKQLLMV